MEIENDIIYEIRETFGIEPSHVMESVLARRPDEFAALYYLLNIKKQRRWRRSMSDVRKSFDKLTMDLEDNEPTAIQDIVDYTVSNASSIRQNSYVLLTYIFTEKLELIEGSRCVAALIVKCNEQSLPLLNQRREGGMRQLAKYFVPLKLSEDIFVSSSNPQ